MGTTLRRGWLVVLAALVGTGLVLTAGVATAQGSAAPTRPNPGRPHVMHRIPPGLRVAAPSGAHLTYFGGRVVSQVQVHQVLYGGGVYETQVSSTASPSVATFFAGVTNTSYVDWLSEYNTVGLQGQDGNPGSNQTIGRGTFGGQHQISPAPANDGPTIDDTNIQAELASQLTAGNLPAPSLDAAGNVNTLYALYFPAGKTITVGTDTTGVTICAYHGTIRYGGHSVPYMVMPDFGPGSGNDAGCGSGTEFQNVTSVSSHELVESMTDTEVGLAASVARPLAWYDASNGEIGDICNGLEQTMTGSDGVHYTVQRQWSNRQHACVINGPVITIAPTAGGMSTPVTVNGGGFFAGERVNVKYAGSGSPPTKTLLCSTIAAADGAFSCSGQIPTGPAAGSPGPHVVQAKGKTSHALATTSFALT